MGNHPRLDLRDVSARFITLILGHAGLVVAASFLFTILILLYAVFNVAIDTDLSRMMSAELPFRQHEEALRKAFPNLDDRVVIVIDADSAERAVQARKQLAGRLRKLRSFSEIFEPGGGDFFDRNGLLYLDTVRLQDLSDNLAGVQPLLALLSEDLGLRRLFTVLRQVVERQGEEVPEEKVAHLFRSLSASLEAALQGRTLHLSWQELMAGSAAKENERRQFIIARPVVQPGALDGAEAVLESIRAEAGRAGIGAASGIRMRFTGDIPLAQENLIAIRGNIGIASFASLVLVGLTLVVALRGSLRLVMANLVTLVVGFIWTLGFAVAAVGKLNLISVTFGVLYIGLGIDFSILLSLRYAEFLASGKTNDEAIAEAANGSARGLFLCAAAAAIGFYSFIPTAYSGASDLGVISGTGMFINLIATLVLLPALLAVFPVRREKVVSASLRAVGLSRKAAAIPYKHSKKVAAAAAVAAIAAGLLASALTFDYNPLNLYNPKSEPVVTAKELFRTSDTSPWTITVLARGEGEARAVTGKLAKVPVVKRAVSIADYVPDSQAEKLTIIADMALFMPQVPENLHIIHEPRDRYLQALLDFRNAIGKRYLSRSVPPPDYARRLHDLLGRVAGMPGNSADSHDLSARIEDALLGNLPFLLERLELSLQAEEVTAADLPPELRAEYVAADGTQRVQVFPQEDISTAGPLERFVREVQKVAPAATDAPVSIFEAGRAVVSSFRQASLYALVAITLFLLISLRSVRMTLLVLLPFALAFLLTAASSVVFDVPLNFANIIVLPLLLGLGVDNDIHLVHRYRTEQPESGNLLETSTSRAVVFSTITNVMGFGTLSWMPHRGLASMGILLTLCMTYLILSTILVLPALLELFGGRRVKGMDPTHEP